MWWGRAGAGVEWGGVERRGTRLGSCGEKKIWCGKGKWRGVGFVWCGVGRSWEGANGVGENDFFFGVGARGRKGQGVGRVGSAEEKGTEGGEGGVGLGEEMRKNFFFVGEKGWCVGTLSNKGGRDGDVCCWWEHVGGRSEEAGL